MSTKILDLIPKDLHEELFKEVAEVMKEKIKNEEKEKINKGKNEVSDLMKTYLEHEKKQKQ